jgi:hypothetical protein
VQFWRFVQWACRCPRRIGRVREISSRLSLVRYLPLSASDAAWAIAESNLPEEPARLKLTEYARDAFRASVFHVDRGVEAYRALWLRQPRPEGLACS